MRRKPLRLKRKPVTLRGIKRTSKRLADGSVQTYYYHRATGLPLDPADLVGSYAAAEKRKRIAGERTLGDLIRFFDSSETFASLSQETRAQYPWKLKRIEQAWGTVPEETFNDPDDADAFAADALAWHQAIGKSSHRSADNLMSALCRVLSFAKEKRRIKYHPIPSFERLYKSDRSEKVWLPELQHLFIKLARQAMKTAMILVRNTGMRAKDIRTFPWTRYNGTQVQIRSSKTGKLLWIPATRELRDHLDSLPRNGALVMLTTGGKAYQRRYFNEHWREDCDLVDTANAEALGADADFVRTAGLNFHDNRGTAATQLCEAGATPQEVAEALCWTVERAQRMFEVYMARRGVMAASAITKLEEYRERVGDSLTRKID